MNFKERLKNNVFIFVRKKAGNIAYLQTNGDVIFKPFLRRCEIEVRREVKIYI